MDIPTEAELKEKAVAPRVTAEDIEANIMGETYTVLPNKRTTVCQLTLRNGFTVEGMSACVSVENYNEKIGNQFARERAVQKIWELMGYELATRLMRE